MNLLFDKENEHQLFDVGIVFCSENEMIYSIYKLFHDIKR